MNLLLSFDNEDEDKNEQDDISKVTRDSQKQKLSFFSSSESKDDDKHERIILVAKRKMYRLSLRFQW